MSCDHWGKNKQNKPYNRPSFLPGGTFKLWHRERNTNRTQQSCLIEESQLKEFCWVWRGWDYLGRLSERMKLHRKRAPGILGGSLDSVVERCGSYKLNSRAITRLGDMQVLSTQVQTTSIDTQTFRTSIQTPEGSHFTSKGICIKACF